ncbi:MAG: hypothetical protein IJM54_08555 [Thermoguttaceae bacterium]|nr:hypothetical protein [Thermoguttaceae bacterium]
MIFREASRAQRGQPSRDRDGIGAQIRFKKRKFWQGRNPETPISGWTGVLVLR